MCIGIQYGIDQLQKSNSSSLFDRNTNLLLMFFFSYEIPSTAFIAFTLRRFYYTISKGKKKPPPKFMSSSPTTPPVGLVGSLTSEFIPAGTCVSQGLQVVRYISDAELGYNYYLTAGPGTSTCFPSSQFPSSGSYYSPGRCPSGYSAACTRTGGNSVGNAVETTVTCCPMYVLWWPRRPRMEWNFVLQN